MILYIIFRILERIVFAYLGQINRELLQLTKQERRDASTCCFTFVCKESGIRPRMQRKLPSGIYKQAWLRFLGTFIGVLSFILILERNVYMFLFLILIDSFGVGIISWFQHKDAPNTQAELTKMVFPDDIATRNVDQAWLENMRKFLGKPVEPKENAIRETNTKVNDGDGGLQRPLLKFL